MAQHTLARGKLGRARIFVVGVEEKIKQIFPKIRNKIIIETDMEKEMEISPLEIHFTCTHLPMPFDSFFFTDPHYFVLALFKLAVT